MTLKTKKEQVTEYMKAGDLMNALKIAKSFKRDFEKEEQAIITRAYEMTVNPRFYEMLGYNKEEQLAKAEKLMTEKYL